MPPVMDKDGNPTDVGLRTIEVFIKDDLTRAEREAMAAEIAAMPEVELYHFVSKREALRRFKREFGDRITVDWSSNPLPASFEILVRESDQVRTVARRFFDDPRVGNTPGTHDAVQYPAEEVRDAIVSSPAP